MPLYEYQCSDCGHQFEEMLRVTDPTPPCVQCGSIRTGKLPNSFGGYHINGNNSASVRPKGAGSKVKKMK